MLLTPARSRSRRLLTRTLGLAVAALTLELAARGGLTVLERRGIRYAPVAGDGLSEANRHALEAFLGGRDSAFQLDADLGWTLRPGYRSAQVTIDAAGRRRAPDRPSPAPDAVRLAAFGDSFTFGGDVADRDAFLEALARLDGAIEVENYGVPAYGLDQAFLRYRKERATADARIVILGYYSENICRDVSVFRPFYNPGTVFPLAKPRFVIAGDRLELLPNPLPTVESYRRLLADPPAVLAALGAHDAFSSAAPRAGRWDWSAAVRLAKLVATRRSPADRDRCYGDPEAFALVSRLLTQFYETVLRDGAEPVILIFPTREELLARQRGSPRNAAPLLALLAERGYRVVDALEALVGEGDGTGLEFLPAHLTPRGNALVAELLRRRLQDFGLLGKNGTAASPRALPAGAVRAPSH